MIPPGDVQEAQDGGETSGVEIPHKIIRVARARALPRTFVLTYLSDFICKHFLLRSRIGSGFDLRIYAAD